VYSLEVMNQTAPQPKRCQCADCKRKLSLIDIACQCRCGKYFCPPHRSAEDHACTWDYKADAKKELLKYMSTAIVAEKVGII
jgi:hypothetical protein